MAADRASLVAAAQRSIALGSRSFALASRLFDRRTREQVWLLYAWCRAADDIADGQELGMGRTVVSDPQAALALIRTRTAGALAGNETGDPAFDALGVIVHECGIPAELPEHVIEGFALDADGFLPADEQALLTYCYHVAGAVGVMMAIVMGVDPRDGATLDRACDLGIAFQLANIARDIEEDAAAGRCYLTATWLAEVGLDRATIGTPASKAKVAQLARRLAKRADLYEASARVGAAALPWRARWAVLSAAGIYGGIARKVAAAGAHAWDQRTVTSASEKAAEVWRGLWQAVIGRATSGSRAGLWTRPRLQVEDQMRSPLSR